MRIPKKLSVSELREWLKTVDEGCLVHAFIDRSAIIYIYNVSPLQKGGDKKDG